MAQFHKKVFTVEELKQVLPEKPSSWKTKQMKMFLKFVNLAELKERFGMKSE